MPLQFANIAMLAGALLVSVPLVLHLIMRQKAKLIVFPALQLIKRREESNRRRMRLRHLLLLLARCAAVILLALALAGPTIGADYVGTLLIFVVVVLSLVVAALAVWLAILYKKSLAAVVAIGTVALGLLITAGTLLFGMTGDSEGDLIDNQEMPVAAAFVFDTSVRMEYVEGNKSRLNQAQDLALWLLLELPARSKVTIFDSRSEASRVSSTRSDAERRIRGLKTAPVAQPLPRTIRRAIDQVTDMDEERQEIYVFTDLTVHGWPTDARLEQAIDDHPNLRVYVIDVGVEQPHDFSLGEIHLESETITNGSPFRVEISVDHKGIGGERTAELHFFESAGNDLITPDERKTVRRAKPVQIKVGPNGGQLVTFNDDGFQRRDAQGGLLPGTYQGFVQLVNTDGKPDGLSWNDRRYFTIDVRPPVRVLVATVDHRTNPDEMLVVPDFLADAIHSHPGFECTVVSFKSLVDVQLDRYPIVCLLDPGPRSDVQWWGMISDYVQRGGNLAMFLGRRVKSEARFSQLAGDLLPAPIENLYRAPRGRDFRLITDRSRHPILKPFQLDSGSIPWGQFPVFRYWQLGPLKANAQTVVSYSGRGHPALIEHRLGRGRVLTMTTPVSDAPNAPKTEAQREYVPWNLLPRGINVSDPFPFLMLVDGMLEYLSDQRSDRLNYEIGQPAILSIEPPWDSIILTTPVGDKPKMNIDPLKRRLVVPEVQRAGTYLVQAGGRTGLHRGFSANLSAEESDLNRISSEQLDEILGADNYRLATNQEEIDREVNEGRSGLPLFEWLLLALAMAMVVEHLLSNLFYRNPKLRAPAASNSPVHV